VNRVDSVKIIADEMEKLYHHHYDRWADEHIEPEDEYVDPIGAEIDRQLSTRSIRELF
jgi:hypothetical protein